MRNLTPERHRELSVELIKLTKQQAEALKGAALFRMTDEEARAYDERHERIQELTRALATFETAA